MTKFSKPLHYGGTTEAWQRLLFTENPPAGVKELFATLNGPDERYKAGSILLVVDPNKQDSEQIAHMQAAKARVDAALAPLGEFSGSLIGGAIAGKIAGTAAANTVCVIVLGAATIEAAGAEALLCTLGVNGAIAYGSDKATSVFGGFVGESLYEVTSNDH